jgi:tetrapyrrole methylase family protein/MazG family protein
MQGKAAKVGFDWENVEGALEKVVEEAGELARASAGDGSIEQEVGDLLFAVVNIARHLEVEPELALRKTCEKFERRFRHIEDKATALGQNLVDMTLQEKDKLWDEAKEQE